MKSVIIIYGPTGIGKTSTSINLAKELNGEIISADSMQIYKDMNIGTAKITKQEMQGVKHHLIDVCSPKRKFTACDFVNKCEQAIEEIFSKNKQPIIVGGTGLYLKSLIEGYDFNNVYKDEKIRKKYKNLAEKFGNEYIFNILKEKNPKRASELNVNDTLRVIRALEILELKKEEVSVKKAQKYNYILFNLTMPREKLYERINQRVDKMLEDGLKDEVEGLIKSGIKQDCQAMQGIGYKEFISYLNGEMNFDDCIELIKKRTRNYAKRQITFLNSFKDVINIPAGENASLEIIKYLKENNYANWRNRKKTRKTI